MTPAVRLIDELIGGDPIVTLASSAPNWVVARDNEHVFVETERSRANGAEPQPIPLAWIEESYRTLKATGTLGRSDLGPAARYRSAFIFALLSRLDGVEARVRPISLQMHDG